MNEPIPPPPPVSYSNPDNARRTVAPDEHPDDVPVQGGLPGAIEALLRHPRRIVFQLHQTRVGNLPGSLLLAALLCALLYGVIVGSFSGGTQLWIAPLKISLGMFFAALICLPSLYIFACLGGSQARVTEVFGLLLGVLALATLLLIGFAPVAWIFSRSIESVAGMGALHLLFWFVSLSFGFRFLRTAFRQIGIRSVAGINLWSIIFVLVTLQMMTTLRPLVGSSTTLLAKEKKFFLIHWTDTMNGKPSPR
jgi:hypothetical protein